MLEDGDDVRVVQLPEHAGLAGETLGERGIARQLGREDFQRDDAIQRGLARFIDKAHAALADERFDFELGKGGGDFRERWRGATGGRGLVRIAQDARGAEAARRIGRDGGFADGTDFGVHADS